MQQYKNYESLPDYELQYIYQHGGDSTDVHEALKELHKRQETKEKQANKTQTNIKNLTIAILILTFLTLVVGAIQLFK